MPRNYMMLTECGLVGRREASIPASAHLSCRLCPSMTLNSLAKIRDAARSSEPEQVIEVDRKSPAET